VTGQVDEQVALEAALKATLKAAQDAPASSRSRERRIASLVDHADDVFEVLRLIDSVDPATTLGGLGRIKRRAKALEEAMLTEVYAAPGDPGSLEDARRKREVAAETARAEQLRHIGTEMEMGKASVLDAMIAEHPHPDETGRWSEEKRTVTRCDGTAYTYTAAVPIGDFAIEVERRIAEERRLRALEPQVDKPVVHDPNAREWPNCHVECMENSRRYPERHECSAYPTGTEFDIADNPWRFKKVTP
jgi:hypothetical protein